MDTALNVVSLVGVLERAPSVRFDHASGTALCSVTLRLDEPSASGTPFRLYVPLEAWGKTGEALGELSAGAVVAITGKLCWRKYVTRSGVEKSGLAVLVQKCAHLVAQQEVAV